MIVDDDDNITFESPEERRAYRKYERLQEKLRKLRSDTTWPATQPEFRKVMAEADLLYASLTNMS